MRCRRVGLVLSAAAMVVATACEPVVHPGFEVVESSTSAVSALLLSANGNFVVATATAAGATVPGPGTWRVDRPSFTGSGRFFAGDRSDPHSGYFYPARVIDQFTGNVEDLGSGVSPQLSGDGRLVVAVSLGTGRGWYEYTVD